MNRNQLKYLVIIAMVMDHVAWAFFPLESVEGQIFHFIGRLTGPTMAFFIYEGYIHTRNVKKYAMRLGIFAVISWVPFSLFESGHIEASFGVIYTLFLGLIAIWIWDKYDAPEGRKYLITFGLCIASILGDWPMFDVLWPLCLFLYRDDEKEKWKRYWGIGLLAVICSSPLEAPFWQNAYNLGIFVPIFLLQHCYSGERGSGHPFHKWFFYVFYPLHLVILWYIKYII